MGRRERAMFPPKRVATGEWLSKLGSERLLCLCLNNFYPKITGKTERGQRLWVNNAIQDDFMWALDKLCFMFHVYLLKSINWTPYDTSVIVFCNACPGGLGFWIPSTSLGFFSIAPSGIEQDLTFYLEALCIL